MSASTSEILRDAYKHYKKFCQKNGLPTAPFADFSARMRAMASKVLSHKIANKIPDASKAHYLATLVEDLNDPMTDAVMRSCIQCGKSCWVSRDLADKADTSQGVICNHCAPELTGKSMAELVAEQLSRL